jgi:hypothetical protein
MPGLGVSAGTAFAQGLAANRPAASTANQGYFWLSTDTNGGTLYQSTGSAWVQVAASVNGTFTGEVSATDFKATGLTGATAASRYVGAVASGAPASGTFAVGDFTIDQTATVWICTMAGTPGTWAQITANPTFSAEVSATDFKPSGLTGATSASRYVGATASGAPASGTFALGDFVIARNGHLWVCTTAGTPGTWTDAGAAGGFADPTTSKGDLIVHGSSTTRLAVGSDTQVLTADSTQTLGVKWAAAPSAGALTLISTQNASGATSALSFTSISGSYSHLLLLGQVRANDSATRYLILQFNSDTGTNYGHQWLYNNSSTTAAGNVGAVETVLYLGQVVDGSAGSTLASTVRIEIPNYAGTTFIKQLTAQMNRLPSTSSTTNLQSVASVGFWNSTSAITRIDVKCDSGNLASGSTVSLYGLSG